MGQFPQVDLNLVAHHSFSLKHDALQEVGQSVGQTSRCEAEFTGASYETIIHCSLKQGAGDRRLCYAVYAGFKVMCQTGLSLLCMA